MMFLVYFWSDRTPINLLLGIGVRTIELYDFSQYSSNLSLVRGRGGAVAYTSVRCAQTDRIWSLLCGFETGSGYIAVCEKV